MSSLLKAAPEEKRSAFYGVMRDWGREKHDGGTIGEHLPGYLTFWSIITVGRGVGAGVRLELLGGAEIERRPRGARFIRR
ncbi:hypothetical protein E8E68_22485 [Pseudomonas sp. BN607]|nr:hypothetical protein [Pseudomonas sp. BN607]